MQLKIVGAGLAGLLAAHAWPQARLFESSGEPKQEHKALLRFRSDAVARLTGVDFRPVTVRKGIWLGGKFVQPSIGTANLYAAKVTGALTGDRSIWNLAAAERFIAPETFYEELLENVGGRITWSHPFDFCSEEPPIVSTAPLGLVAEQMGILLPPELVFQRAAIDVSRYRVRGADVFQTIYFPDPETLVYRASITGSMLIVERMWVQSVQEKLLGHRLAASAEESQEDITMVAAAFGINSLDPIDRVHQKYGKIVPIEEAARKALLHTLTRGHGIFSLGRFATWRNVLLDDVVQDIAVVRRLMRASPYERAMFAS